MDVSELRKRGTDLANALAAMLDEIRSALVDYENNPDERMAYSYRKWRDQAWPNLSRDLQLLQQSLSTPMDPLHANSMLEIAASNRGLSKNLDTLVFEFSGGEHAQRLEENKIRIVLAASRVVHALAAFAPHG